MAATDVLGALDEAPLPLGDGQILPWRGGVPEDERAVAEERLAQLIADQDFSAGRDENLFALTRALASSDPVADRANRCVAGAKAITDEDLATALWATACLHACEGGRLEQAKSYLAQCKVPQRLGTHSQVVIARAFVALDEKNANEALSWLGDRDRPVNVAPNVRGRVDLMRAHAFALAGRTDDARAATDAAVDRFGLHICNAIADHLPSRWSMDRSLLDEHLRAYARRIARRSRLWGAILGVIAAFGAVGLVFATGIETLVLTGLALGLGGLFCAYLLSKSKLMAKLAREGQARTARVVGFKERGGAAFDSGSTYQILLSLSEPGEAQGTLLRDFERLLPSSTDKYRDTKQRILCLPDVSTRALVWHA